MSGNRPKRVALVWAPQETRTEWIAQELGAEVWHIHFFKYKRPFYAPFKYPLQTVATLWRLVRQRPTTVYVTNPPVFAALTVALYCAFTRTAYVMDTHPPSLYHPKLKWTIPLQKIAARRALANVTDQERFKRQIDSWGTHTVILERPPMVLPSPPLPLDDPVRVLVINTFAIDEPIEPLFDAARRCPEVELRVTGDLARADHSQVARAPENVVFTGYLRGDAYWNELRDATVVVALTTFEHSILLATQDAMTVRRPLVTSDQPVLRDVLGDAAVFVANEGEAVAAGIREAIERREDLAERIEMARHDADERWKTGFAELSEILDSHES
ncbi:MAG: glycosyltransferase [Acidimicrobiales bacterium]|nr:glycosyltransferase [Acidimicrobiales bacterium]